MKKFFSFAIVSALLFSTLFGCSKGENGDVKNLPNAKLGVIETSGEKKKSYIHFLDDDLKPVYKEEYNQANLNPPFHLPNYQDGYMYALPEGYSELKNEHIALKYNCKDGSYKELDMGINAMNDSALSEKYFYGVNSVAGFSTIARVDINTGDRIEAKFPKVFIPIIEVLGDYLYGIERDLFSNDKKNFLIQYNPETLEELAKYDITQYGSPWRLFQHENKVYISNKRISYDNGKTTTPLTTITVFDIVTKTFSTLDTGTEYPNDMFVKDDIMFVSHFEHTTSEGNKITAINLITGEKKTQTFDHLVRQVLLDNDYFYILGDKEMYKYKYENSQFNLITKQEIALDTSGTHFYVPAFFICS